MDPRSVTLISTNSELLERARRVMPGGVSSPVRAYRAVGGEPPFIVSAEGCRVTDADGHVYVDLVSSWGALIAGHAHPAVIAAIESQARRGTSYGAPSPLEVELAERIVGSVASVEMVRFVSSGTEAVMSALRLARAATGRDAILKFAGCYHGHADALLSRAGSGLVTLGLPDSAGVPAAVARDTLTVAYGDLVAAERVASEIPLAAIVVEPIAGNMGCVVPDRAFLVGLRALADRTGALLIFDEVITGFRVARAGAQGLFGVRPDLTCFGKIIGGGLPVGAYAAPRRLMSLVAPLGPVYQAGTLSGNPLAMAAGLATLELLDERAYATLEDRGARIEGELTDAVRAAGMPARVQRAGSLLTLFFTDRPVRNEDDARTSDRDRFARFHAAMLRRSVMLPPSQFECWFLSLAHDDEAITTILDAARASLGELAA
jgi:glutamate-1-semialdehyde 2,1-aminomutase